MREAAVPLNGVSQRAARRSSVKESRKRRCGNASGFEHVLQEIAQLTDQLPEDSRLHALSQNLNGSGVGSAGETLPGDESHQPLDFGDAKHSDPALAGHKRTTVYLPGTSQNGGDLRALAVDHGEPETMARGAVALHVFLSSGDAVPDTVRLRSVSNGIPFANPS